MRGSIISRRIRSGSSSATAARALSPSLAVMTRICSRCRVNCTILRTVGLSSTTNTTGSFTNWTSFAPVPGACVDQFLSGACVDQTYADWRHGHVLSGRNGARLPLAGRPSSRHAFDCDQLSLLSPEQRSSTDHSGGARSASYPPLLPEYWQISAPSASVNLALPRDRRVEAAPL